MELGTAADWLSAIANVGVALAAGAAAMQGIRSLTAWRHETVGRRRIELAEDVLTDFYEAGDALRWARFPASYGGEAAGRPGRDAEDDRIRVHRDIYYVAIARLNEKAELFSRLRTRRFRVRATFGFDFIKPFDDIHLIHTRIIVSAQQLIGMDPDRRDAEVQELWARHESIVWGVPTGDDALSNEIKLKVQEAETLFRPEILGEGSAAKRSKHRLSVT